MCQFLDIAHYIILRVVFLQLQELLFIKGILEEVANDSLATNKVQ